MDVQRYLRVVRLRKGKIKLAEFQLRKKDKGLSLFALTASPGPEEILEAMQERGKQGELRAMVLEAVELQKIGLVIVRTPGDTGSASVNAVHYEARLPWFRRLVLRLRGIPLAEFFNKHFSERLMAAAEFNKGIS